ncbi:hypothetical protein Ahy_A05g024877 [Arachis hypogaea]|uniref:Retrotransposon gag domain-containing protein n=1 Tax=Arachis hypogaea TaxID=3818 RepID=A0A445D7A4_ARAHY|nr:hypothetical protein Ahy_A05g024877 [Arachis hypogaea]
MAIHESKFDRLARQVERIARIVDYDEGERQDARGNNKSFENLFQNENDAFINRENSQLIPCGQNADDVLARLRANQFGELTDLVALKYEDGEIIDDYMIRFKNSRSRCYVSLPESEVVKIAIMGLGFYMRRKLRNVHIPDLAHLAERVRQVEILKKEKEKYKNERRLKSKHFSRKEKVSYVAMESSYEEFDLDAEVDLAELRKGSPYVCSLLKKISNNEKSNDSKLKSEKRYSFDILKSNQIFDVLVKNKQLILPEGRTLLLVKDLKRKPYCKFHQITSHSTNNCVRFRDLIQEAIMEGRPKGSASTSSTLNLGISKFNVESNARRKNHTSFHAELENSQVQHGLKGRTKGDILPHLR